MARLRRYQLLLTPGELAAVESALRCSFVPANANEFTERALAKVQHAPIVKVDNDGPTGGRVAPVIDENDNDLPWED